MNRNNIFIQQIFFLFVLRFALVLTAKTSKASPYVINWSGFKWYIDHKNSSTAGTNNWNAGNAWIDSTNRLHLKVSRLKDTGHWSSAEVFSDADLMYGTYKWKVQGRIDEFDPNIVFGLYSYGGPSGSNEIDIEVSSWGEKVAKPYNIHYTTYPGHLNGTSRIHRSKRFELNGFQTTHWYTWTPKKVIFGSQHGFQDVPTAQRFFVYVTPPQFTKDMPKTPIRVHMNLWLWGGNPPQNGKDVEVIIKEFSFTPL